MVAEETLSSSMVQPKVFQVVVLYYLKSVALFSRFRIFAVLQNPQGHLTEDKPVL